MSIKPPLQSVAGLKITVLGAARSGLAAARFLHQQGAEVFLSELNPKQISAATWRLLEQENIPYESGTHSPAVFQADLVVLSPGIPDSAPVVQELERRGLPYFSELEVASWFIPGPIIAVTGSNGKSTTVALIHHLLQTAGRDSRLGGNVGTAACDLLLQEPAPGVETVFVLEVSSFQLDHAATLKPKVAVLLNLTPDHLNRYPNVEAYYDSKRRLFCNQGSGDMAVLNAADERCLATATPAEHRWLFAVEPQLDLSLKAWQERGHFYVRREGETVPVASRKSFGPPGPHNAANALAALCAVDAFIPEVSDMALGLSSFQPLPHRLEFVGRIKGLAFYNDSKATNVDSTLVALQSFTEPLWIILGGRDKGADFSILKPLLQKNARGCLLVGEAAATIKAQLGAGLPVVECGTIPAAIDYALEHGQEGEVVLLSPACASFDQFRDFEERGEYFRSLVQQKQAVHGA